MFFVCALGKDGEKETCADQQSSSSVVPVDAESRGGGGIATDVDVVTMHSTGVAVAHKDLPIDRFQRVSFLLFFFFLFFFSFL
jgi:hypothetical protein